MLGYRAVVHIFCVVWIPWYVSIRRFTSLAEQRLSQTCHRVHIFYRGWSMNFWTTVWFRSMSNVIIVDVISDLLRNDMLFDEPWIYPLINMHIFMIPLNYLIICYILVLMICCDKVIISLLLWNCLISFWIHNPLRNLATMHHKWLSMKRLVYEGRYFCNLILCRTAKLRRNNLAHADHDTLLIFLYLLNVWLSLQLLLANQVHLLIVNRTCWLINR